MDATVDPALRADEAYVHITLRNGRVLEKHVEHAVGSLERPMSNRELEAKFHGLAAEILTMEESDRLLDLCWNVERLEDAGDLAKATVPRHLVAQIE
jgi:2-methylcitrate dehydratase PrpD